MFIIIRLIGQSPIHYTQINNQLIKNQCKICQSADNSSYLNLWNKEKIDQLYHQLHSVISNDSQDSIINISSELKLLLDKEHDRFNYIAPFYNFHGIQLDEMRLYQEAQTSFEKGLRFAKKPKVRSIILINLATHYIGDTSKDFNKALNYLSESEVLVNALRDSSLLTRIYKNKALCLFGNKRFDASEKAYKEAIQLETLLKDSLGLVKSYQNLAILYYEQYLDNKAIPLFKKALLLAKKVGNLPLLKTNQENMAIVYENAKDYKNSLTTYKAFQATKDSINNIERVRNLSIIEQTRLTEQGEQREKEIKLQQILFATIGSAILAILLLIGYQYRNSLKKNKIIATQKQKVDELNTIKDELLSVLGHDLRSPMQHLVSVFDRSFRVLKKGEEGKLLKLLQHGNLAVSQTSILLDNVLQWVTQQNKQGYFKKESVALFPLIQQIQGTFLPITQMRDIELVNEVDTENTILADRNSLKIIIRNLVDNAIKFSSPNEQIRITASTNADGRQGIHIQDTGIGMSAEVQAKILSTSAATVDASGRKSTGLGLRICKEFIQRHEGELTIESVEGEGSRFSVWLPVG